MVSFADTPPRAPALYQPRIPTRWQKEKEAAGGRGLDFPDDPRFIGPWVIGECVGKGASGHVKVARHRRTGEYAAVKVLPLQPVFDSRNSLATQQAKSEKQRLGIDREITMMKLMHHPNIMRIYDVYEGENELYLILEYVKGGELFDFLVNRGRLGPLEALSFFKQIIYGLNYAHSFSIIHRDLKPENILIKSLNPPVLKIADWGMAAFAPPAWQLETSCGSPHYASPEIVRGLKYQGTATDIWSCGVILFALLTGTLPFDDKDVKSLLGKVKLGKFEIPLSVDRIARDLISRMLVVDVKERITMAEILEHPWMKTDTPRVFYVPAPSVEELARPVQSKAHIDRDIFESLCVIWGRHADPNIIKDDLLSPPGQGTLAKAFYFLLQKHKQKALSDHGIVMDVNVETIGDRVVHKHYLAPRPRESWKIDLDTSLATPRAAANDRRVLMLDVPMTETSPQSRIRTPSPVGPRTQKSRPSSTPPSPNKTPRPVVTRASSVTSDGRDHPPLRERKFAQVSRRTSVRAVAGTTITSPRILPMLRASTEPTQDIYTPPPMVRTSQQMYGVRRTTAQEARSTSSRVPIITRAMTAPERSQSVEPTPPSSSNASTPTQETYETSIAANAMASSVIHAPAPVQSIPLAILPMISAPRVASAEIQKTIDDIADRMNLLVAHENAHYAQKIQLRRQSQQYRQIQPKLVQRQQPSSEAPSSLNPYSPLLDEVGGGDATDGEMTPRAVERDKENQSYGSWLQIHRPSFQATTPLRDMANVTYQRQPLGETNRELEKERDKDKGKRSKKLRPPALDLRNAGHRQSIASPILSPPLSTAGSEFKGWFTNLFNWKGQSYALYSFEDVATTREEMTKALAHAGVTILTSETNLVKCRLDELYDGITGAVVQKQVRFRVEFGPCTTQTHSNTHSGGGDTFAVPPTPKLLTPRLMSTPMSPIPSSGGHTSMVTLVLERGAVSAFKAMYLRVREMWVLDSQERMLGEEFDEGGSTPRPRSVIA